MRLTLLFAVVALVGCGPVDEDGVGDAPDSGAMGSTQMGGAGGTGGVGAMAPDAGNAGTGGNDGGRGGAGGVGGAMAPDARPAQMQPDAQPSGPPAACNVDRLFRDVCMDPPNTRGAKVLSKNGYACAFCATYKPDGITVDKQYVGCSPFPGEVCVMGCGECK